LRIWRLWLSTGVLEGVLPPTAHRVRRTSTSWKTPPLCSSFAGNMAGFDYLIQKYRKPIVNFMYRMRTIRRSPRNSPRRSFSASIAPRDLPGGGPLQHLALRIATNLGVNYARDTRLERAASTVYLDEADSETGTTPTSLT